MISTFSFLLFLWLAAHAQRYVVDDVRTRGTFRNVAGA